MHISLLALSYQRKLYDLKKIEALDFSGPWWDANYNDTMTINANNAGTATRLKTGRNAASKEWEKIQQAYDAQSAG